MDERGRSSLLPKKEEKGMQWREKIEEASGRERLSDENFGGSSQRTQNGWT